MTIPHPLERDLGTLWEFCWRARTFVQRGPTRDGEKQLFARGLIAYAIELATAVGWLTTIKNGPGAMTLMTTLEATQQTIEQIVNEMSDNDVRSVLRARKGTIKVNVEKWKNTVEKRFRKEVDSPLRSDCRHGGSIHWGWLMEAEGEEREYEYSVKKQRAAVMGADAALVLILELFGEAAQEHQQWNYEQITGNTWREEDLDWNTSTNGVHWNGPYRTIQPKPLPKEMPQVLKAIKEYENTASIVFANWGERRTEDTQEPWGDYRLYSTKTALAVGESVYNLIRAGMYGAAFALARASWESAANAHFVWNETPSQQLLQFLQNEDRHVDRSIPLPKFHTKWQVPTAKKWAILKETNAMVLAELAKGERVQGQRWATKVSNSEHCPYSEDELTNLIRCTAMNLMFLKASYFHFKVAESTDMFERLMDQWKPKWPAFQVLETG